MQFKSWYRSVVPTLLLLAVSAVSNAQLSVDISVNLAPPVLPVYEQPPIPGDGYLWTPGYWAWSDDVQDYYWVPGTWVLAPQPGYLWTPGYWAAAGALFFWHAGYWGPHVGFYGGVNYGYGYGGRGFDGGYWQGEHMYYNRSVTNINSTNITNVYNRTVINNVTVNRASYNGGNGGVRAEATSAELSAVHERHVALAPAQQQHEQMARENPVLRASANNGHPPIAATARPGAFSGAGVIPARPQPQERSQPQAQPRQQPQERSQPQAQPRQQPQERSQPQAQPRQQPQERPQPQAQPRQQPQERPQPQARPQQQRAEHQDDHGHH